MKKIFILLVFYILFIGNLYSFADSHIEHYSYSPDGLVYEFDVWLKDNDPIQHWWHRDKDSNPPLSPGEAARIAEEFMVRIPSGKDMKTWRLQEISLNKMADVPKERWIYIISFSGIPKALIWNGPVPTFDVIVKMDGTIPEPKIKDKSEK